jgi:5,10-methylene-tetrahydrofolate dehydrogenase/methenyl tetrahydrofolate cyclohydrolase
MPTLIIDGRAAREAWMPELAARIKQLIKPPHLAIIQVGDRADTASYIRAKTAFAGKIGVKVKHIHLPESATEKEVIEKVAILNADADVNGIVVQLPLPISIDRDAVIEAVDPHKDVDGLDFIQCQALAGRR